jgi:hypothetical protein
MILFAFMRVHSRPLLPFLVPNPRISANNIVTVCPSNSQEHCNQ